MVRGSSNERSCAHRKRSSASGHYDRSNLVIGAAALQRHPQFAITVGGESVEAVGSVEGQPATEPSRCSEIIKSRFLGATPRAMDISTVGPTRAPIAYRLPCTAPGAPGVLRKARMFSAVSVIARICGPIGGYWQYRSWSGGPSTTTSTLRIRPRAGRNARAVGAVPLRTSATGARRYPNGLETKHIRRWWRAALWLDRPQLSRRTPIPAPGR